MKKIIALSLVGLFTFSCTIFNCTAFASYSSNYKREIKNNERKMKQIASSKNLSDYYKKREIRRLEKKNSYLKKYR